MVIFFTKKGYTPLVLDTDGVNFSLPSNVDERTYIGRGINPQIVKMIKCEPLFQVKLL